jgi:RNA polymerase sigma factor (sigma-70 family)
MKARWYKYIKIAERISRKVTKQEREDMRNDIIVALAQAEIDSKKRLKNNNLETIAYRTKTRYDFARRERGSLSSLDLMLERNPLLEATLGHEDDTTLELIEEEDENEQNEIFEKALEKLSEREQQVIRLYLGFNEQRVKMNFRQIAKELGISHMTAQRDIVVALKKFKNVTSKR